MDADEIEYCKWLHVKTDTAASALVFFGLPPGHLVEKDPEATLRNGRPTFRVLSPGWIAQQNKRVSK